MVIFRDEFAAFVDGAFGFAMARPLLFLTFAVFGAVIGYVVSYRRYRWRFKESDRRIAELQEEVLSLKLRLASRAPATPVLEKVTRPKQKTA